MRQDMEFNDITAQKKKLKKIILIVLAVCVLFAAVYFVIASIPQKRTQSTDYTDALKDYSFYPEFKGDIFKDPDYTEDMRKISFTDENMLVFGEELNEEALEKHDASVRFMYDYINNIIRGDVEKYNACFSSAYYSKVYPKEYFTMQRLYDIDLIKVTERYEDGMKVYIFKLDYKILKNDGTFRKDISSESTRTKTIYVTNREGRLAIDGESIHHVDYDIK